MLWAADWQQPVTEINPLLSLTVSDRQFRLFACACCRNVWHLLDERCRYVVEVVERYVDGLVPAEALVAVHQVITSMRHKQAMKRAMRILATHMEFTAGTTRIGFAADARGVVLSLAVAGRVAGRVGAIVQDEIVQARLLRDIIGNPWRPCRLVKSWLSREVIAVANDVYENRSWGELAVLADALEEAGCADTRLLGAFTGTGVACAWVLGS
jgi:hypothetical protein